MSSRICVKNLPKYVTEDRLRDFFSQKGQVTDSKLMRTKDGKSRQFGFVGFTTVQEADAAINYFNNSFLDTSRITCQFAHKVGDPNIPRPWSRYSLNKHHHPTNNIKDSKPAIPAHKKTKNDHDPQLEEFLQIMQHRTKSKLWANDTPTPPSLHQNKLPLNNKLDKHDNKSYAHPDDTIKGQGTILSEEEEDEPNVMVNDDVVMSDKDYFRSRIKKEWSDSDHSDDDDDGSSNSHKTSNLGPAIEPDDFKGEDVSPREHENINSTDPSSSPNTKNEQALVSGRLFVHNLPYTATEEELETHFTKYGSISQVHIVVDKDTKRAKGIAYVSFTLPESAARALEEMDGSIFQGRLLHVMPAKQKNISDKQEINDFGNNLSKTFKQKKNEEKKASEASGNTRAWNSLFMRPDAVVENIARKFCVSKGELLDRESDDLAVRIALGETQVVAETKKALLSAGVNIASLDQFAAEVAAGDKTAKTTGRSNHVILVTNLPYGSSESELSNMFGKFGSLDKIILPPTKTLALVIFLEPVEARSAFSGLAYKRYKDGPLYLHWAPDNILSQTPNVGNNTLEGGVDLKRASLEQQVEETTEADVDHDRIESRSLYVKNLNFRSSDEIVKKHFTEHMNGGKILSVRVKKHVKNGKNVSMGFGFIEFDSVDTAVNVCRDLQGTVLDGHALILQLCHAKKDEQLPKKTENDRSSTKLIVRNVAFEATEKDLKQLFSPFGQIKRLRLPRKLGGKHRGFAFVEYVTKQEARNAFQALANSHLYGRHLVLENAKEGESLEELRDRTAAQFSDSAKLSKKRKHTTILDEGNVKFKGNTDEF